MFLKSSKIRIFTLSFFETTVVDYAEFTSVLSFHPALFIKPCVKNYTNLKIKIVLFSVFLNNCGRNFVLYSHSNLPLVFILLLFQFNCYLELKGFG